jgi:DNA-directed RNA polymerase specialized sigma24 family protein
MTDDEALTFLALGDQKQKASAHEHLAAVWVPTLLVVFERHLPPDVAGQAALGALARLMRKAEKDPDNLPPPEHLAAWLFKAGWRSASDAKRKARGRQKAKVDSLDDHEGEVETWAAAGSAGASRAADAEFARAVLRFIFGLEQPERGILLYDTLKHIEYLTNEEVDLHDEELIDCGKSCGIWTRDALRSHRSRARKDLMEYLITSGFRDYLMEKGFGGYMKEKGFEE